MTDKATGAALPPIRERHVHMFKREADGGMEGVEADGEFGGGVAPKQ